MKSVQLALVLSVLAVAAWAKDIKVAAPAPTTSSLQYAALHLDRILADPELVQGYFECLMDMGPCTPGGSDLKTILPDALATGCASCSEHQKAASDRVIKFAVEKRPELLKVLEKKYDPEGAYQSRIGASQVAEPAPAVSPAVLADPVPAVVVAPAVLAN